VSDGFDLEVLEGSMAICRREPGESVPVWATGGTFSAVVRTAEELSIVCPWSAVPVGVRRHGPMRALRVAGTLDLALTGVLLEIARPLASARVSLFAVSTWDTDYVLVHADDLDSAIDALHVAGHRVRETA
jgi:hypothetical protein